MPRNEPSPRTVELSFPLPRTHCGFPLGNGTLGALVWGADRLCITVNRNDYWDHRDGEQITGERIYEQVKARFDPSDPSGVESAFTHRPWPGDGLFLNSRLPAGRFELLLREGVSLDRGVLDALRGELVVHLQGSDARLVLRVHPTQPVLWIEDGGHAVQQVAARPAWEWVSRELKSRDYAEPVRIDAGERCGWVQASPQDDAMAAVCHRGGDHAAIALTLHRDEAEARRLAEAELDAAMRGGPASFTRQVRRWWRTYWRDVPKVSIPDAFFSRFLTLALYKFAAATNPAATLPAGLQGPWVEEYQLPSWSGDYHFNVNVQQVYTLAFSIGKAEHALPLLDMLDRLLPVFREQARAVMGIDDGILMSHAMDDRGQVCGGVAANGSLDQAVSGWTAQLYWKYYQQTGDAVFLRRRAMPFMAGVMRVFEAMLEWRDGVPVVAVSISAEYAQPLANGKRQKYGVNPSYQLACMHMLASALVEGAKVLGDEPAASWLAIQKTLPAWTLIGPAEKQRMAIWEGQDLAVSHRHHSHLACIYPFDTVGAMTPAKRGIIERSIHRWLEVGMSDWSEWCLPWAAIIQARIGYREGPYLLLKLCRDLYINEGLATVYVPRLRGFSVHAVDRYKTPLEQHEVMQIDGTMAIATALYEMLVHEHGGEIRFFPAVPVAWSEVSFEDVRVSGDLRAGGVMRGGAVERVTLLSGRDRDVIVDVPGYREMMVRQGAAVARVTLPGVVRLKAGEPMIGEVDRR